MTIPVLDMKHKAGEDMTWDQTFEVFPQLVTERLLLRQIQAKDAMSLYSYFSKDEVTTFYDLETFRSPQQAIELIESIQYRYTMEKQIRWGITLKDDDTLIGTCGFHSLEKEHLKAEIGYDLHPQYWGKGIMTEVIHTVVKFAFESMNANRIEAFYDPLNHASRRVLEKNGFQFEGVLRKRFFEKGRYVDAAISSLLKEDFNLKLIGKV